MRKLESRYPNDIVVVGIHCGKFPHERVSASIRDASLRLNAVHPTMNDRQFRMWRAYAVRAWPTLVAVSPTGYVVGMRAGEFDADAVVPFVDRVLAGARADGTLDPRPQHFAPDAPGTAPGMLAFPGKVAVDGRRIAIADSGHHRVVIGTVDPVASRMTVQRVVGGMAAGFRDGAAPLFHNPQGLAFDGDTLCVADAGNHAIRAVTLATGNVRTVAGTGAQARTAAHLAAGAMSSPWDVAHDAGTLYVAMAGLHQAWRVDVATGHAAVHSGSGAEELHDGPHGVAALAQPMGICLSPDTIYLADSESSAIRSAARDPGGAVRTIVGTGLFDFGDEDGEADDVRLQHPQGIARAPDGRLLAADSYNGSLKWIDPVRRRAETWLRGLREPTGVAVAGDWLFIAESNAHRIVVGRLDSSEVAELRID